jgi:tryptophan 2,3-dioxygenase
MAAAQPPLSRAEYEHLLRRVEELRAALELVAQDRHEAALRVLRRHHLHPVSGEAS